MVTIKKLAAQAGLTAKNAKKMPKTCLNIESLVLQACQHCAASLCGKVLTLTHQGVLLHLLARIAYRLVYVAVDRDISVGVIDLRHYYSCARTSGRRCSRRCCRLHFSWVAHDDLAGVEVKAQLFKRAFDGTNAIGAHAL